MITFKHAKIEKPIIFDINIIYDIVIENEKFYYDFIMDLLTLNEEVISIYDDNYGELQLKDNCFLLTDPFILDPNNKKYLSFIYKNSEKKYFNDSRREKMKNIQNNINDLLNDVSMDFDIATNFNYELSLSDILIATDFRISTDFSSFLNRIISFLRSITTINKLKFVFIVGFLDMINERDMDAFLKETSLLGINLINLSYRKPIRKRNGVDYIIIEENLCEY